MTTQTIQLGFKRLIPDHPLTLEFARALSPGFWVMCLFLLCNLATTGISRAQSSSDSANVGVVASTAWNDKNERLKPDPDSIGESDIRIVKDKPTIYITFERAGTREPLRRGESAEGIWLRLHNNTRWSIELNMTTPPSPEYGDVELSYEVIGDEKVVEDGRCHVCLSDRLPAGKSVLFSIPREKLGKRLSMRVAFSYEWEFGGRQTTTGEPLHYVYLDSNALPPGALVTSNVR